MAYTLDMNPFLDKARDILRRTTSPVEKGLGATTQYVRNVRRDLSTLKGESTGKLNFLAKTWDASTQGRSKDLIYQYAQGRNTQPGAIKGLLSPQEPRHPMSFKGSSEKALVKQVLSSPNPKEEMSRNFGLHAGWRLQETEAMKNRLKPLVLGGVTTIGTATDLGVSHHQKKMQEKRNAQLLNQYLGYSQRGY